MVEHAVDRQPQHRLEGELALAGHPCPAIIFEADLRKAHRADEAAHIGGGVVHRPKLGEDARIHQAELTRIQWKIVLAHRRDQPVEGAPAPADRKSTRLNSSHYCASRMPSSA